MDGGIRVGRAVGGELVSGEVASGSSKVVRGRKCLTAARV